MSSIHFTQNVIQSYDYLRKLGILVVDQYVPKIEGNISLKFYEAIKKRYRGEVHNKLVMENKKKQQLESSKETIGEECKHSGQVQLNHPSSDIT